MHARVDYVRCLDLSTAPDVRDFQHELDLVTHGDRLLNFVADGLEYGIYHADSAQLRSMTRQLVSDTYTRKGYRTVLGDEGLNITIAIAQGCRFIGTATLGVDSAAGIEADAVYKKDIDYFRAAGASVCEITNFAVAGGVRSKIVTGAIFHLLFIIASYIFSRTDIFIEINPSHRGFYERLFGFTCRSSVNICPRVNAPACLLQVKTDVLESEIFKLDAELNFPIMFSCAEIDLIVSKFKLDLRRSSLHQLHKYGTMEAAP
jgi:hypothetical protein